MQRKNEQDHKPRSDNMDDQEEIKCIRDSSEQSMDSDEEEKDLLGFPESQPHISKVPSIAKLNHMSDRSLAKWIRRIPNSKQRNLSIKEVLERFSRAALLEMMTAFVIINGIAKSRLPQVEEEKSNISQSSGRNGLELSRKANGDPDARLNHGMGH